jgi:F0F1-type ATP synthase assembly protein I
MNRHAHFVGGIVAGPSTGFLLAKRANRAPKPAEVGGWFAGGVLGAKTPDILEPAYCPGHREVCHSASVLAMDIALLQSQTLEHCINYLHDKAAEYRRRSEAEPDSSFWFSLLAVLCEFAAGVLLGFLGGYASHLILDSTTPCGLPLV